ncbi:uncharacterized protein LOC108167014, partial [Poecilia reticulata]|uniref:uncharacterized protein LOC108167014 n=1 Tax=Poecilia reticulata TaxID=8081 RepID=UPI0007EB7260
YSTSRNRFKSFHATYNLPFPSLDVSTLCLFITYSRLVLKIRTSTIQSYLAGINFFCKLSAGVICPSISHCHVNTLIKGCKKQKPNGVIPRLPLTTDLLHKCISTLRSGYSSNFVDRTLESTFLLAFFGFLRCSEFAPTSSIHNPLIHPCLSDISILSHDTTIFTLRKSKTDQLAVSCPIYLFCLDSSHNPYEPIFNYVQSRFAANASPHDPLFISEPGKQASRFWFSCHFRQVLSLSGISPDHYSAHSFRIGAASSASSQGVPDHTIQILGRWSSQAYHLHIRNNLKDLFQAHSLLSCI